MQLRYATILSIRIFFACLLGVGFLSTTHGQILRPQKTQPAQPIPSNKVIEWPSPTQVIKELKGFRQYPATAQWAEELEQIFGFICKKNSVTDPQVLQAIGLLEQKAIEVHGLVNTVSDQNAGMLSAESVELISQLQRFQYRLARRAVIWRTVVLHAANTDLTPAVKPQVIPVSYSRLSFEGLVDDQWREYLQLSNLEKSFQSVSPNPKQQRDAARKFLARYHSASLSQEQRLWLDTLPLDGTMQVIRDAASEQVDHRELLLMMEKIQWKDSSVYSDKLNTQYQNLLWSDDPVAGELAGLIDSHYRNANVRIAINQRLINRMLPPLPSTTEPISERLLGAEVSGQNHISNQLRIALIPNPDEIELQLETSGQVTSDTVAKRSGFLIQNQGLANFQVFKRLAFNRTGVISESPQVTANATQRLVGLRGNLDRVPVLGWVATRIARNKVEEETPKAESLTRRRIENDARERVEQQVTQQLQQFRDSLQRFVLDPLTSVELEPETLQTSTTDQRIVGRYRLAGRDQLAAHQPRPADYESDLLTVQLHQSAFNNLLSRVGLNGKKFTPTTLNEHLSKVTGFTGTSEYTGDEAELTFAKYDPIRIDFKDGMVALQFKFSRLKIGSTNALKNVIVKVNLLPQHTGTQLHLEVQSPLDIKGKNLRGKKLGFGETSLVVLMFNKLLEEKYSFEVLPPVVKKQTSHLDFAIDRLSLSDGWCGVSLAIPFSDSPIPIVSPAEVSTTIEPQLQAPLQTTLEPQPQQQQAKPSRRAGSTGRAANSTFRR